MFDASSMKSRLNELKAFEKSNFAMTWSGGMLTRYRLVACTAASAPPLTPTPSWIGWSICLDRSVAWLQHISRPTFARPCHCDWANSAIALSKCYQSAPEKHRLDLSWAAPTEHQVDKVGKCVKQPVGCLLAAYQIFQVSRTETIRAPTRPVRGRSDRF